jgi:hypothetical protein
VSESAPNARGSDDSDTSLGSWLVKPPVRLGPQHPPTSKRTTTTGNGTRPSKKATVAIDAANPATERVKTHRGCLARSVSSPMAGAATTCGTSSTATSRPPTAALFVRSRASSTSATRAPLVTGPAQAKKRLGSAHRIGFPRSRSCVACTTDRMVWATIRAYFRSAIKDS